MCGIAGIVNITSDDDIEEGHIRSILNKIHHRGPDDQGTCLLNEKAVGFGAVRLSFVDLKHGAQPLQSHDGDAVIVYNGEVYGYQQLKLQLQQKGYIFHTQTDTEFILNYFLENKYVGLKNLNGEFAFAIYNHKDKSVVLVRDRFGTKPLYYTIFHSKLIFASEIKAILAYPGIRACFNKRTILEQFMRIDSLERTLFANIHVLKPGYYLLLKQGNIDIRSYWDLYLPTIVEETANTNSFEFYKYKLHECLSHAVRMRMEGEVEIGCFLSGGLDSSFIAALMQRYTYKPIKTFSIQFKDKVYDESHYAKIVSTHIGSEHHVITLSASDLTHHFPKALYHCEHLTQQIEGTGKYLLAKLAAQYVKGVLVGEGADELFLGYPWFKIIKHMTNAYHYNQVIAMETARKGIDLVIYRHSNRNNIKKLLGYYPIALGNTRTMQEQFQLSLFSKDFLQCMADLNLNHAYIEDIDTHMIDGRSDIRQNQYAFIKKTFPTYIVKFLGDKVEMASSIESRLPYLDKAIVDLVSEIPEQFLLCNLQEKYILKEIAKSYLPAQITSRIKHGYSAPILQGFLEQAAPSYFNELLSPNITKEINIFNVEKVTHLLKKCRDRHGNLDQTTTLLERATVFILSVHLMHKMYIEQNAHLYF